MESVDLAIVGAGAAGLMAGTWAGRTAQGMRIVAFESARKPGAKILVAGGGRCNVTHEVVRETDFAGAPRHAIRSVLRRFDVQETITFFRDIGVTLKREETGKLFPTTDRARTVLDALLLAAGAAGVEVRSPHRVERIRREKGGFVLEGSANDSSPRAEIRARRVILSTGGRSLPKSGSDGHGFTLARELGHTPTERIFPALVPLTLAHGFFLRGLAGLSTPARLTVRSGSGRALVAIDGPLLCTHFGISGPAALDVSRHWIEASLGDPGATMTACWLPGEDAAAVERLLLAAGSGRSSARLLRLRGIPERLADALCAHAGVDASAPASRLRREQRNALARAVSDLPLPITGHRGFTDAEVTAGGIPLDQMRLKTMESTVCAGLSLCGEICAVDGRIGGFNFQWAWSSGYVAGIAAGKALLAG